MTPALASGMVSAGLAILVVVATWGEGGGEPRTLLVVHGLVTLLVAVRLASGPVATAARIAPATGAAFAGFAAAVVFGGARAPYAFAAHEVLLEIATFGAVAWLASENPRRTLTWVVPIVIAAAAAHALWALAERLTTGEPRAASSFLNPNHLAAWLVAALFLAIGRALDPGSVARRRRIALIAVAIVAAGIVAAASRGALIGLVGGGVIWVSVSWKGSRRGTLLAGAGVLAVLAAAAGLAIRDRFESWDPFAHSRPRIWRASLEILAQDPMWGAGPGQFATAAAGVNFPVNDAPLRFARSFSTPHSDWLRAPCEFGIPASVLILLAACAAARAARRNAASRALGSDGPAILAALSALTAQASVDDLTTRPAVWLLAAVFVGAAAAGTRGEVSPTLRPGARLGAVALLGLAFVLGEVAPFLAWSRANDLPRGRLDGAQAARLEAALSRNPFHPDLRLRLAEHLAPPDASTMTPESYAAAREAAERAARLAPRNARYRVGVARVEGAATRLLLRDVGSRERAASRYEDAERIAPHDPMIVLEKGEFLLATGDPAGAARAAERALEIEPRAVLPRLVLAEALLEQRGDASRVDALLDDANDLATKFKRVERLSRYESALLDLDVERYRRIRHALGAADQ